MNIASLKDIISRFLNEYIVPARYHIKILQDPAMLFTLAIGLLGDLAASTNSEDVEESYLNELRENLQFSARFFDAYLQSRLKEELDPYLLLLGAASYYLRKRGRWFQNDLRDKKSGEYGSV
jgi:hypothetical protein